MIDRDRSPGIYADPANVLIIARSARQLAGAAKAAGYRPFAIDLFGDVDTRAVSHDYVRIAMDEDLAFRVPELHRAVNYMRNRYAQMPIVWGSGFEAQAHCLAALAVKSALYGTAPAGVFAVNNPQRLARSLHQLGIAHPKPSYILRDRESAALVKRRGGCGGLNVRRVRGPLLAESCEYFQQEVDGQHFSAAFIASSHGVHLLGVCESLSQGAHARLPFAYRGTLADPNRTSDLADKVKRILSPLAARFHLQGLCGFDFVLNASAEIVAIEINPRPTASFDLLAAPGEIFQAHVAASTGKAFSLDAYVDVRGSMICFALQAFKLVRGLNWPSWVADRPQSGTEIDAGMPICTVYASAETAAATRALLDRRCGTVARSIGCGRFEHEID